MGRARIAWALLLIAMGSTGAWAERLDKSACNVLNAELSGLVAAGTRDDMDRGPAWAQANLPQEKLHNILRLIELEEQLEFRCGMPRSRVATTAPAKVDKVVIPEHPEKKPQSKSSATKSIPDRVGMAKPVAEVVKTVAGTPAAAKPASTKPTPPETTAAVGPPLAPTPAVSPAPAATTAAAATAPAPAEPLKSSRRQSSAGYISPSEVNPFFVTRYGDTQ